MAPAHDPGASLSPNPTTRPALANLVEQLGDYRYSVRDTATVELTLLNPSELPTLVRLYREERRHEPKLRLRYAIEYVYYRQFMMGESGFLGIGLSHLSAWDPQIGQTTDGIVAERVQEGYPAYRAGLRDLDVILDFDGGPVARLMDPASIPKNRDGAGQIEAGFRPPNIGVLAFMSNVKRREPGSRIPVRVLRGGENRRVMVPPGLTDLSGLAATEIPFANDRLIRSQTVGGFAVEQTSGASWLADAGLGPGDVIIGVDGRGFGSELTVEEFQHAMRTARQSAMLEIRRYTEHTFVITLGQRPPELMNADEWKAAQARFAAWWRDEMGASSVRIPKPKWPLYSGLRTEWPDTRLLP